VTSSRSWVKIIIDYPKRLGFISCDMKNKAAQQLGRLGGKVTSEAKAIAARANGKNGGRPRHCYALHWVCGYGTTYANSGNDAVSVLRFDSVADRDFCVREFGAPNHCPTATIEPVPATDKNVRYAIMNGDFNHVD